MKNAAKKKLYIVIGIAVGIGVLCLIFFWLLPTMLEKWISEDSIEAFLNERSNWAGLLYLALFQSVQFVTIFFPGNIVQIAGGIVFGTWLGFAVCMASFVGTNAAEFAILRRLLARRIARTDKKPGARVQKILDWLNSSDPFFMCMLAFMMPGIPNGFVPYAAIRTEISLRQYTLAAFLGSFVQILLMCSIGSKIIEGDYTTSFFLVIGSLALIFTLFKLKSKLQDLMRKPHRTYVRQAKKK